MVVGATLLTVMLGATPGGHGPWAEVVSPLVKVRPAGPGVPAIAGERRAQLWAARGECEAFQVLARPPLEDVTAYLLPLRGPGKRIPARLYREAYLDLANATNAQGATGRWPDPLIPVVDAYAGEPRRAFPAASTPEQPLVVYAEVCVPEAQKPGAYRGELVLEAKGRAKVKLPVRLEVQPFAIPATSSLPNSFGISQYGVARGHQLAIDSDAARTTLQRYATALLAHRLSAHGMSMTGPAVKKTPAGLAFDFTAFDAEMAPFFEGTALASGARFTSAELREGPKSLSDDERVAYYRAYREHFEQKRWPVELFFYAKDEPKPEELPLVKAQAEKVHKAGKLGVLVTTAYDPKLEGAADFLCPVLNCFFPREGPQTCRNVQSVASARGHLAPHAKVWWYQSCMSHGCDGGPAATPELERAYSGWASYMIDHPATSNRAMGPLAYLAGVDGELYFDTVHAFATGDPWQSVWAFGGNGDGTLFYPGTPEKIGGTTPVPVESLRLKAIRDGLEDYELFKLLEARGDGAFARAQVKALVRSGYEITSDPKVWEATRRRLLQRIAQLPERAELPRR